MNQRAITQFLSHCPQIFMPQVVGFSEGEFVMVFSLLITEREFMSDDVGRMRRPNKTSKELCATKSKRMRSLLSSSGR